MTVPKETQKEQPKQEAPKVPLLQEKMVVEEKKAVAPIRHSPRTNYIQEKKLSAKKNDDDYEEEADEDFPLLGKRKQPSRVKKQVTFNTLEMSEELDQKISSAKMYKERSR